VILRSLQVQNFRAVRRASLTFGPGLNILYGPNDIGKSSLADGIRAGFLLPCASAESRKLAPWGTDLVPEVIIEFEVHGVLWKLKKTFGSGARGTACLERCTSGGIWREEAKTKEVDFKLREMLAWGILAPGDKGAPRGLPESYLTTALLGRQDGIAAILDASIEADDADSGRKRVTAALGVLGQDPRVSLLLQRLEEQVALAFMANGRPKPGGPLGKATEKLRVQERRLQQLEEEIRKSADVEQRILELAEQRTRAVEKSDRIERRLDLLRALNAAEAEVARVHANQQLVENARRELEAAGQDVKAKQERLQQAVAEQQKLDQDLRAARERLAKVEGVYEQVRDNAQQAREARRAELIGQRDAASRRKQAAGEVFEAGKQVRDRQNELSQAKAECESAQREHSRAQKVAMLAPASVVRAVAPTSRHRCSKRHRGFLAILSDIG
jgi:DNA repair exonuclease SbcCD ATPase subunit